MPYYEQFDEYLPESYLLYGGPSTGKSTQILEWAKRHPESTVYVIDGDNKFRRVWLAEFPELTNIKYYTVFDEDSRKEQFAKVRDELMAMPYKERERQCIALEMVDKYWEWAQQKYHEVVSNMSRAEYLMKLRTDNPDQTGLSDKDSQNLWRLTKDSHNTDFMDTIINKIRCNTIWTAPALALSTVTRAGKPQESNEILELYSPYGFKPEGEKRNGHRVDTVILLEYEAKTKKRKWTTVKDKAKPGGKQPVPYAWRKEYNSFWDSYVEETGAPI